jgi:hypothetical protein
VSHRFLFVALAGFLAVLLAGAAPPAPTVTWQFVERDSFGTHVFIGPPEPSAATGEIEMETLWVFPSVSVGYSGRSRTFNISRERIAISCDFLSVRDLRKAQRLTLAGLPSDPPGAAVNSPARFPKWYWMYTPMIRRICGEPDPARPSFASAGAAIAYATANQPELENQVPPLNPAPAGFRGSPLDWTGRYLLVSRSPRGAALFLDMNSLDRDSEPGLVSARTLTVLAPGTDKMANVALRLVSFDCAKAAETDQREWSWVGPGLEASESKSSWTRSLVDRPLARKALDAACRDPAPEAPPFATVGAAMLSVGAAPPPSPPPLVAPPPKSGPVPDVVINPVWARKPNG